jgi:hypothetical protein
VTIVLASDKYRFDGGQAALLRHDWAQTVNDPDPSALLLGNCIDNRIEGVTADLPAEYELFLADATVEIQPHNFRRKFVTLEPWNIRITSEDLERDQSLVRVPDADLYLLTFLHEDKPVQNRRVTVYLENRSFEIPTDQTGTVSVLGDPRTYILAIEDGWKLDVRPIGA